MFLTSGGSSSGSGMEGDSALATNNSYYGNVLTEAVGENVVFGDFLYKKLSDNKWYKAKANAITTIPCMRMALETATVGNSCLMLLPGGIARYDSWTWTADGTILELWLSSSIAGALTESINTGAGNFGQVVAIAIASNQIEFCPSMNIARF